VCQEDTQLAVGLGGGIIALIVIIAVIVAAVLAFGAFKGVQAYNASKDLDESGQTNPMYEAAGQYGENKLYGDYKAFK